MFAPSMYLPMNLEQLCRDSNLLGGLMIATPLRDPYDEAIIAEVKGVERYFEAGLEWIKIAVERCARISGIDYFGNPAEFAVDEAMSHSTMSWPATGILISRIDVNSIRVTLPTVVVIEMYHKGHDPVDRASVF